MSLIDCLLPHRVEIKGARVVRFGMALGSPTERELKMEASKKARQKEEHRRYWAKVKAERNARRRKRWC